MGKRLQDIGVENNEQNRRDYRELLFNTDPVIVRLWFRIEMQIKIFYDYSINFQAISQNVSGVILFEETLYQKAADGTPLVELLNKRGIIPGIKVDKGVVPLMGSEDECTTQGLKCFIWKS